MKAAAIQLNARRDKPKNIKNAVRLAERAARNGAKLICLPEVFSYRGPLGAQANNIKERIPGESIKPFQAVARSQKVHILAGSICERIERSQKIYNTSVLIDSRGRIIAKYRKINLFNAVIGKTKLRESDNLRAGSRLATAPIGKFCAGLTICYDLRFPELYRDYARRGVDIIFVPSSFTKQTGKAHWETLLRARAIENQCYIIAPNQTGKDHRNVATYGNSMIIDPWGRVLKRASSTKEEIIYAEILAKALVEARSVLPDICKIKR